MTKNKLYQIIVDKFNSELYDKSQEFPTNKINIIQIRDAPTIKIRAIILDNESELHLIIDEKKREIFHHCPSFILHSSKEDKICVHFIKLLSMINEEISLKIIGDLDKYNLTSEDIGSEKKSKNFSILAQNCFETNNCIEGLSFLNKAIINQCECRNIIHQYLELSIKNNLFIEFFDFLKSGYNNELGEYLADFSHYIEKGFKRFLNTIPDYSFFNIIKILESMDIIFKVKNLDFLGDLSEVFREMVNNSDLNSKYFSIYFIKNHYEHLSKMNEDFTEILSEDQLNSLKEDAVNYFITEIDNFCIIEKLKLLKKQFETLDIPQDRYLENYRNYKKEIKELEKKVYLKKFSFLKLLMEKYDIKKTKVGFRKKRNIYLVDHAQENLDNTAYLYIISHLGFSGLDLKTIKSSEIGKNYFLFNDLFQDDLSSLSDAFYYRKQFWGEDIDYKINSMDGFSLISKNIDYSYDIDQKYSDINDVLIIEWDLAQKPIQGSIVNAYGSKIIIPDQNNPLFHDLKPFDLCYCKKNPVKIEGSLIKTINIISKCSFKDAINSTSKGMAFIEGYYPLSLIKDVISKKINPIKADEIVINNPNKIFVPNYVKFIKAFREFLFDYINREKDYVFNELKNELEHKSNQIISLLNLTNDLAGLKLPYSDLIKKTLSEDISLKELKLRFLREINTYIKDLLEKQDVGSTSIFDLKKLRNTSFSKYANDILKIRKDEFESAVVKMIDDLYDLSAIRDTYYGKRIIDILGIGIKATVKPDLFKKFSDFAMKLNLKINIIKIG